MPAESALPYLPKNILIYIQNMLKVLKKHDQSD